MTQPSKWWEIENDIFNQTGHRLICGVDEAGRGPLAGPVCAAAVILPFGLEIEGLNDSKKLTENARERLFDIILDKATATGIAFATNQEIDQINILNATFLAMRRATQQLNPAPEFAIIDGNMVRDIPVVARAIVKGDQKSASIAAASVLAKVTRDRYMAKLAAEYPEYMFEKHKGYPTKLHYQLLEQFGASPVHRRSFLKKLNLG